MTVAFAGGPIVLAGAPVAPTAVVVRLGDEVLRLTPPVARSRVAVGGGAWRVSARGPCLAVELEGDAAGAEPHTLEVPVPGELRTEPRSRQHLAARVSLTVRRGRRTLFAGESPLGGAGARAAGGGVMSLMPPGRAAPAARRAAIASGSVAMSPAKRPITVHSARRRSPAAWSTGWTRASLHSSAVPSWSGRAQWAISTRTVPGSDHAANSAGPASSG